ncbi:hypothetical protein MRB53_034820 [Persea americana]|uniref:Uncharacterized protein n=1 Tax=Persea americana TaxID=3435 RepID=A0ACC2K3F1_PERAE|nr:hypothetical protein MRB53_034820 [Persea americana]
MEGTLACGGWFGCSCEKVAPPKNSIRKMLMASETLFKGFRSLGPQSGDEKDMNGWDLRRVPSGPDPLHHNSSPKKPQTP